MRAWWLPFAVIATLAAEARAEVESPPIQTPHPTLIWTLTQAVPSPVWFVGNGEAHFGATWQLTPLLIAYRMPPSAPKLRSFVVEPIARVSGSLELVVSPMYVPSLPDRLGVAPGVRTTLPLSEHGEALAVWISASYLVAGDTRSALYEAGLTTLFGIAGVRVGYAPTLFGGAKLFGLSFRYF